MHTSVGGGARGARHLAVPFTAVELQDRLWAARQRAVRERTVPFLYAQIREERHCSKRSTWTAAGAACAFRSNNPPNSVMYWDSDIAKWIEMASYTLATHYDPALDARSTTSSRASRRRSGRTATSTAISFAANPRSAGPTCATGTSSIALGHLIEAAVAHAQATGKTSLIDVVRRYADYIATAFGPGRTSGAAIAAIRRSSSPW